MRSIFNPFSRSPRRLLDLRLDQGIDRCAECGGNFAPSGISTGYATQAATGRRICFKCCAENDRQAMIEQGKYTLYLTQSTEDDLMAPGLDKPKKWFVSNWPGSLKFKTYGPPQKFHHPFSAHAVIVYFPGPDKKVWSARRIGKWTDIAHCRRLKENA